MRLTTDYLVLGAGASGLAFTDSLVAESDVEVTVIDRRQAVGGHWVDAYPFVRLHIPSAYYGVNSLPLGQDRIDRAGENAGFYERATGEGVREHFAEAAARLVKTGRVRILTGHQHLGAGADGERLRELGSGALHEVAVRRKVVDARYLEASVPATHTPNFDVSPAARVVPVNALPAAAGSTSSYTLLGSGKTAVDACVWLLDNDVPPDRIRWIRPREAWFLDRAHHQPLAQVGSIIEGLSLDAEAAAGANDIGDLFARLEASGRLSRLDPSRSATMFRATMLSARELRAVRQVDDVVRLGHVRRIESARIVLSQGEVETGPDVLHVDCTAAGLRDAPATPMFKPGRIVLQQVRQNSPCFNAALAGFVEAHRDDDSAKNQLCPPNPYATRVEDWPRLMRRTWATEYRWLRESDLSEWVAQSRLNLLRGLPEHANEPDVQTALQRYLSHVGPAIDKLGHLDVSGPGERPVAPADRELPQWEARVPATDHTGTRRFERQAGAPHVQRPSAS